MMKSNLKFAGDFADLFCMMIVWITHVLPNDSNPDEVLPWKKPWKGLEFVESVSTLLGAVIVMSGLFYEHF